MPGSPLHDLLLQDLLDSMGGGGSQEGFIDTAPRMLKKKKIEFVQPGPLGLM